MDIKKVLKNHISLKPKSNITEIENAIDELSEKDCNYIFSLIQKQEENNTLPFRISRLVNHGEQPNSERFTIEFETGISILN